MANNQKCHDMYIYIVLDVYIYIDIYIYTFIFLYLNKNVDIKNKMTLRFDHATGMAGMWQWVVRPDVEVKVWGLVLLIKLIKGFPNVSTIWNGEDDTYKFPMALGRDDFKMMKDEWVDQQVITKRYKCKPCILQLLQMDTGKTNKQICQTAVHPLKGFNSTKTSDSSSDATFKHQLCERSFDSAHPIRPPRKKTRKLFKGYGDFKSLRYHGNITMAFKCMWLLSNRVIVKMIQTAQKGLVMLV